MLAAALFAATTLSDSTLFRQWVIPWNTAPVGALAWLLLAASIAWLDGQRRPFVVGLLAGGISACRPVDAVLVLLCLAALAWHDLRDRRSTGWRLVFKDWGWFASGAAAVLLPSAALHLAIYGLTPSSYMRASAQLGFTLHSLGWKAYILLIDPYPWFADGKGLLQHAHWIALGFAGFLPALLRGPADRLLAAALAVNGILYVSYIDLLPTGLWRFMNVHYFSWAIPGYALLAALLLRDLARAGQARRIGCASVAGTLLMLCVQFDPKAVAEPKPAKAVDFVGPTPPFLETYFSKPLAIRDSHGVLLNNTDVRVFLYPDGVRVVGLRRDLVGPVEWLPNQAPLGFEGVPAARRWAVSARLAWPPRWLASPPAPGIPVPTT